MYSLADYYRRRGLVAQQEAARTLNDQTRHVFQEVARGWFELADISDHLDRREDRLARRAAKNPIMKAEQRADKHQ
jgi:hypothetical protein